MYKEAAYIEKRGFGTARYPFNGWKEDLPVRQYSTGMLDITKAAT